MTSFMKVTICTDNENYINNHNGDEKHGTVPLMNHTFLLQQTLRLGSQFTPTAHYVLA